MQDEETRQVNFRFPVSLIERLKEHARICSTKRCRSCRPIPMAKPFRKRARVAGHKIGALAKPVWVCQSCGVQHPSKVEVCYCGGLAFDHFHSRGEANHWANLKMQEAAGMIEGLRRQVRFTLYAAQSYTRDGEEQIVDYKGGAIDPLAAWKMRHMAAQGHPVTIVGD